MEGRMKKLVALAFGCALALLILELGLRAVRYSFPKFCRADVHAGHTLRPGAAGWCRDEGDAWMAVNALGMRDRERTLERAPGVTRIAVLGDSFMEARQVPYEESLPALLEAGLNARGRTVEVLNFGTTGYSTGQELLLLQHRVAAFKPDLVLVAFCTANDVADNIRWPHSDPIRPYFRLEGGKLTLDEGYRSTLYQKRDASAPFQLLYAVSDWSRIVQLLADRATNASKRSGPPSLHVGAAGPIGAEDAIWIEPREAKWREAWDVTDALFAALDAEAKRQGARLAVFEIPAGHDGVPDSKRFDETAKFFGVPDLDYPVRHSTALFAKLGVPFRALTPVFRETARREKVYLNGFERTNTLGRGHWNQRGHRVAADALAPWLETLLPAR
jgi:lysophospholipase L1-like esterase